MTTDTPDDIEARISRDREAMPVELRSRVLAAVGTALAEARPRPAPPARTPNDERIVVATALALACLTILVVTPSLLLAPRTDARPSLPAPPTAARPDPSGTAPRSTPPGILTASDAESVLAASF